MLRPLLLKETMLTSYLSPSFFPLCSGNIISSHKWHGCGNAPFNQINKDENVQRFTLSAIRGELLERERKRKREIVLGYYTRVNYYP